MTNECIDVSVQKKKNKTSQKSKLVIYEPNSTLSYQPWTEKSRDIPFQSHNKGKGIGDGEDKVAAELNTTPLGQNSDYDMKINIEGVIFDCDVKKLDINTFNTGVNGRNALRPIKTKITSLLDLFRIIMNSPLITQEVKILLQNFENVSPDELCVSNRDKLYEICTILNKTRENIIKTLPEISPFIKNDGSNFIVEMNLFKYYKICLESEMDFPVEYEDFRHSLILLNDISHEYIINPDKLKESLNNLVKIFSDVKLIFVDEKKGYCIFDNISKIKFERITRGHPRFRVMI